MRQVGYLPELHRAARSAKYRKLNVHLAGPRLYKNPKAHGVKPSVVRHPIADHVE